MGERIISLSENSALIPENPEINLPSKCTQSEHGFWFEDVHLGFEVWAAVCKFRRERFVGGRSAAYRDSDICVTQNESIAAFSGFGLTGKAATVKCVKQKIARAITGKCPASAIPAMRRWRKPNDQQFGAGVAEAGDRFSPVVPLEKGAFFGVRHRLSIAHEPRAFAARYNRAVQNSQLFLD